MSDYFNSGLGYSDFKLLLDSPKKYRHAIEVGRVETPAFALGSLTHAMVLGQPIEYVVKDWDGRTKEGKARAAEVADQGLAFVSEDDWRDAEGMAAAVAAHPVAGPLFADGAAEAPATRQLDGTSIRAKADWLRNDGTIVDLKTTRDASPDAFARSCFRYGYHIQAANYLDTFDATRFVVVAVEKSAPYLISVHEFDPFAIRRGRELIRQALDIYKTCTAADHWPDFSGDTTHIVSLPAWEMDDEIEVA